MSSPKVSFRAFLYRHSRLSIFITTVYLRKENKIKWWQITRDRRYTSHHLSWPLYKSDPKQSLYLTFHRLWPNKFLAIISATSFGGLGNEQWIYLMWLQRDLNWALVSISDSLFLNSRGLWDIIYKIRRFLNKSWTSCLYYTTLKTHGCHWEGSKN